MIWIKRIFKFILFLLLFLATIAALWFAAAKIYGDDKLNPEILSFYAINPQAYVKDNGYIALMGVNAPATVQDTYGWALQLVQDSLQQPAGKESFFSDKWDAIKDKVVMQGDTKITQCWLKMRWKYLKTEPVTTCNNEQDVINLINANNVLLTRYRDQFGYTRFIDIPQEGVPNGKELIQEQELFLAYLIVAGQLHPEEALQEWIKNNLFLKRALADQDSAIMRSILMIMYGENQKILPSLLGKDAALSVKYEKPLLEALAPFGPKDVNFALASKSEYQVAGIVIGKFDNYNRNKFYQFQQDLIALWNAPISQQKIDSQRLDNKYRPIITLSDWRSPVSSIVTNLTIHGMLKSKDLITAMHTRDAISRILNLYVQMKAQGITPEAIPFFLKSSTENLYDPFTNQPFSYDAASKLIYFTVPDVPDSKQGFLIN